MPIQHMTILSNLAGALYDFLPANPHPYSDPSISFPGCANRCGVGNLWPGGSKRPAVTRLLQTTLEQKPSQFCPLIVSIIETAIPYRIQKKNPITREEIIAINRLIAELGHKIPELWSPAFLDGLPRKEVTPEVPSDQMDLSGLKQEYVDLPRLPAQQRGYGFQRFLTLLFEAHRLAPRSAFRLTGEEIDGSFDLGQDTYLLEAKWQKQQSGQSELLIFQGKVQGKAAWTRGLFISFLGFTAEGLDAFNRGRSTNIIGMDGLDLFYIVDGKIGLPEAIRRKARRAAETNDFFVPLQDLI